MSFLNRKKADAPAESSATGLDAPVGPIVGKGAPTPRRRDKAPQRGPVPPPPRTQREAFKRAKTQSKPLSKQERRARAAERRERMMRGDDTAVLPRDRGPVRRYVRDLVDSRRNLTGLLLPVLLFTFLVSTFSPLLQLYAMAVMLIMMIAAIVDSTVAGKQISRKVAEKFPNGDPTGLSTKGFSLGYYGFNRAMLPRRWRAPRPQVKPGDVVV